MQDLTLMPDGAKVLRAMIVSCGSAACFEATRLLDAVDKGTSYRKIALDEQGNWRMAAFSRLWKFAAEEGIENLDASAVARYFGGQFHIDIMTRNSNHAGLGQYLGSAVGLVTHVLLPLSKEGLYRNAGRTIRFEKTVHVNPGDPGATFYHLGLLVNIDLPDSVIEDILDEQAKSIVFSSALSALDPVVKTPGEWFEGLNCTAKMAAQS